MIEGSSVLLYQLFYNLTNNSLKFTKKDTAPVITLGSETVLLPALSGNDRPYVRIRIEDNGIGFNQEQATSIFATFVRLNAKDKFEGTGLGMALCQKIAERHGGRIRAEGREGVGAAFIIELPLKQTGR